VVQNESKFMPFKHLALSPFATNWDYLGWFRLGNVPVLFPNGFGFLFLAPVRWCEDKACIERRIRDLAPFWAAGVLSRPHSSGAKEKRPRLHALLTGGPQWPVRRRDRLAV
jgi:hypothetical protein